MPANLALRLAATLLLLPLFPASLPASMMIDRSIVLFDPSRPPREDVTVTNPDAEPVYLDVEILAVTDPGTPQEKRTVVTDPESIGLIAAPRRTVVPPGGQRTVRLVYLNAFDDKEHIYRVTVRPLVGDIKAEGMAVKVVVAYQLLVVVPPRKPVWQVEGVRDGSRLTLRNTGNSNALFFDGRQCPAPAPALDGKVLPVDPASCSEIAVFRLYPGNERVVELAQDGPVTFSVTTGNGTEQRTFP